MAAMKYSALRKPKKRWLIDLILLFIPSTALLESRNLVQGKIPFRWERSILTNFLKGAARRGGFDHHFLHASLDQPFRQQLQMLLFRPWKNASFGWEECWFRAGVGFSATPALSAL
jgi:hypothetical protein